MAPELRSQLGTYLRSQLGTYFMEQGSESWQWVAQKVSARLCELATRLGTSSHNLDDTFLDNPVC